MYRRYVVDKSTQTVTISMDDIHNEWTRSRGEPVQILYGGLPPPTTPYVARPQRQQTNNYRARWRHDNILGDPIRCVTVPPAVYAQEQPRFCTPINNPYSSNPTSTIQQPPGRRGPRQLVHGHLADTFPPPPAYTARHHNTPRSQAPRVGTRLIPGRQATSPVFDAIPTPTDDDDLAAESFRYNVQQRRPRYKYAMRTYGQPPQENLHDNHDRF